MRQNCLAAGALPRSPLGGASSAPPDPLAGGEGAGCPLPKNSTPALGSSGLDPRPFGPLTCPPKYGRRIDATASNTWFCRAFWCD